MSSKRHKGRDCAYCGKKNASTTADHVIARKFFLEEDRANLPQVPACADCNNKKSALEHYAATALMAGSNHVDGDLYRREKVAPRIAKNRKLRLSMGLDTDPVLLNVNGIIRPMHILKIEYEKINKLMSLIVIGLYYFHFGLPLDRQFYSEVCMFAPDHDPALWASMAAYFPPGSERVTANLGRGGFVYEGIQSPAHHAFTVWRMAWHGGIPLHGGNSPPQGVAVFWGITRPTPEAMHKIA